ALPTRAHSSVRPFLTRLAASLSRPFVFVAFPRPPIPTLFPYTTLFRSLFAAVLASAILPAHAQTEDAAARAAERARAEALEADGKALRAEAEATYEATVPGCYDRFFVNRCIDQAKKKRLETVKRARELEAESRRLTLAERQRVAAEAGAKAERPLTPATPTALPATPAAAVSA